MMKLLTLIVILIMHNNSLANQQISNLITPMSYFINHVKQLNDLQRNLDKYKNIIYIN